MLPANILSNVLELNNKSIIVKFINKNEKIPENLEVFFLSTFIFHLLRDYN